MEPRDAAYMAQAAATFGAGLLVAFVWRRGLPLPIRAATLAAATLVAVPVALIYDLMLAAVAAAWLVRDPAGLAGWERVALTAFFVLSMVPPGLAEAVAPPGWADRGIGPPRPHCRPRSAHAPLDRPRRCNPGVISVVRARTLLVPGEID